LERVAAVAAGPKFFQLLGLKDPGRTRELIERCRAAGYAALCLTVDASVRAKRERELRYGLGITPKLPLLTALHCATRPRWWLGQLWNGRLKMDNLNAAPNGPELIRGTQALGQQLDPTFSWKAAAAVIRQWDGPFAIKGILCTEDARQAVDIGATALMISNHGGRQLDAAASPFEVLPEIAEAVGDRVEVILDGGVRRGTDVLKALARGAKACAIGRPYLFGLGAGGEQGVLKALQLLRQELTCAMQLTGCVDVARVSERILRGAT
jgi:L-lactate dehydrogenase (cytochrome)